MRSALALLAVPALVAAAQARAPVPSVPCSDVIGQARSGRDAGYRVVLGRVSVPPATLPEVVATRSRPWRFWRKAGLVVLAGATPVSVSIPPRWRRRAAIAWGSSGIVGALAFVPCPRPPNRWNAYAGGFYTAARSECVPLTFTVGGRSRTVRFGIGRPCAHGGRT